MFVNEKRTPCDGLERNKEWNEEGWSRTTQLRFHVHNNKNCVRTVQ